MLHTIIRESPPSNTFDLFQKIMAHMDPPEADKFLFGKARSYPFADKIAFWLTTGVLDPPGKLMRQFKERIEAGEASEDAWHHIWDEIKVRR